jgi:hypothetical protein
MHSFDSLGIPVVDEAERSFDITTGKKRNSRQTRRRSTYKDINVEINKESERGSRMSQA